MADAVTLQGLSSAEAKSRLAQDGPNELGAGRRQGLLRQLLFRFASPLVAVLLIASGVSAALGDWLNASIIALIVLVSTGLEFYQSLRSEQAVEALKGRGAPTATALRDGRWAELPRRELVAGDLMRLGAGDLVPADGLLLSGKDLHVNQAALTGESLPVEKEPAPEGKELPDLESPHGLFLGSSVVSGTGVALILATGSRTQLGRIALSLARRAPPNEFERGTAQFSAFISRTVLFLVLFVLLVNLALRRDGLESLLFAVALAVGLTPEFLPAITTITLSRSAVRMAKRKVIVKNLAAIQNFGSIDILCSDKTGTLTSGEMRYAASLSPDGQPDPAVLRSAYLNSRFESGVDNALDQAILAQQIEGAEAYTKLDEIPFDFERRRVSVVVESGGVPRLICKGAPENVLEACNSVRGGRLDEAVRAQIVQTYQALGQQGYRVLAVAEREMPEQTAYKVSDEQGLSLTGFVSFLDPPLEGVAELIRDLRDDGVEVKILTGDSELVARQVCEQVGLEVGEIVLGSQLEATDDAALGVLAERTRLFARVAPAQKNRVIAALKARGHVVGYMGDGINDAPSLHTADVGISFAGAVDVAKDAAQFILLERSLRVLQEGILEGRRAFGNVMKYLLMGTSSNFGNVFSMAGATAFLPFLPMLPTQILLNNFLYDLSQITIPTDAVDPAFVRKPRRWDIGLIKDFMLYVGPVSSLFDFLTFFVLLRFFRAGEAEFHTGWFAESLATQTLVIFLIRTLGSPFRSRPSPALTFTVLAVVLVGLALPYTPLAPALGFVPLPAAYYGFLAAATLAYLLLVEVVKRWLFGRRFGV